MANFDMGAVLASPWASKEDAPTSGIELIIAGVSQEELGPEKERKFALHFKYGFKPMLINKTNVRILSALFGPQTDGWINRTVVVYNDPTVGFGGQIMGGLRVRGVAAPAASPAVPKTLEQLKAEYLAATAAANLAAGATTDPALSNHPAFRSE